METNNGKSVGQWVDERLATLHPAGDCEPNVSAGLTRLRQGLPEKTWLTSRWAWVAAGAAAIVLAFPALPSPHTIAHKCLQCSVAVWQTLAASGSSQTTFTPSAARKPAPDFRLKDADGKDVSLYDLKGDVVLVNFWATWCHGCQTEIPWFVEFQKQYANRGLVVVGISMDDDGWKSVKPWLQQKSVNYPIVIGNAALGKQYGLDGMPLTVLIDHRGKVADTHPGLVDQQDTEKKIRALLQETSGSP